jgi:hypothetical protein
MRHGMLVGLMILAAAAAVPSGHAAAQEPGAAQRGEMKRLEGLVGTWKGEGWMEFGPGQRHTFMSEERVTAKAGGLALLIEGQHKDSTGTTVVHDAVALVTYDERAKLFRFRALDARGHAADSEAQVGNATLSWTIPAAQGMTMRYTSSWTANEWQEVGEMSTDGKTWRKFFEMKLKRVG